MYNPLKISIAGSGKVARVLSLEFKNAGHDIAQIISRNSDSGNKLAEEVDAEYITLDEEVNKVDFIAVLVSDDSITKVSSMLPTDIPQIHASGVTSIDALKSETQGVVWPIKSINSKSVNSTLKGTPMAIEANDEGFKSKLSSAIKSIGGEGFGADSSQRAIIHLAAVFTDNFANHCLTLSQDILKGADLKTNLMSTLANGLFEGAMCGDSASRQTGVAVRGDIGSQMKHLGLLERDSQKEFYKFLSKQIKEYYEL
ncbi:MAG: hypothetical protein CL847_05760 [Crocinitomicaceae bacterium]|nr:hypothetical protein [Crocinitomicaceae bacterium]|tara:strand:- start:5313 stop:6080 length:768 start_codon:yes stop_codon:yes gene_type:complete